MTIIKQYLLLIVFLYIGIYIPVWYLRNIEKQTKIEWQENKARLIKRCYDEAYNAKGAEWEETCLKNSLTGDCTLPINYYQTLSKLLSEDYDRCVAIYSEGSNGSSN